MQDLLRPEEGLEELIGSGYRIIQSRRGYRYSLDTVLLAHFAASLPGRAALELGMGNGAACLLLAKARSDLKIVGIEVQETLAGQAQRSVMLNGLEARIQVLVADWAEVPHLLPARSFDLVLANPPFRAAGTGRCSPRGEVAAAKHGPPGSMESLLQAAFWVLKARGRLALITHASGLANLMASLRQAHLEPKILRAVHSFPQSKGEFLLVLARKEGRPGLEVLPPLFLYARRGGGGGRPRPSAEMKDIYALFRSPGTHEGQAD